MKDKYIRIVYRSEPIGKEGIILYLTTFDIDKYNQELNKKEIGIEVFTDDINFNVILSGVISPLTSRSILGTYRPGKFIFTVSYPFAFSYCSWSSQGKNTEVVCHSLLKWTTFCQNSPP